MLLFEKIRGKKNIVLFNNPILIYENIWHRWAGIQNFFLHPPPSWEQGCHLTRTAANASVLGFVLLYNKVTYGWNHQALDWQPSKSCYKSLTWGSSETPVGVGWSTSVCVLQASKAPHAPSPGIIANLVWLWVLKWNFQIQQVIHSGVCICLKASRQKQFLCSNEKEEQTEDRALSMQILQGRQEPNQGIHYDEII